MNAGRMGRGLLLGRCQKATPQMIASREAVQWKSESGNEGERRLLPDVTVDRDLHAVTPGSDRLQLTTLT